MAQAKRDVATAAEAGADMVELRIDALTNREFVEKVLGDGLLRHLVLPCIVTCRPPGKAAGVLG